MTIIGEPGIGKSHLAAELTAIAGDGGRVLTGRCLAYGEGITYWPMREIVRAGEGRPLDRRARRLAAESRRRPRTRWRRRWGSRRAEAGEDTRLGVPTADRCARADAAADRRHRRRAPRPSPRSWTCSSTSPRGFTTRLALIVWVTRPDLFERHPDWASRDRSGQRARARSALGCGQRCAASRRSPALAWSGRTERRIAEAAGGNPLFLEQLVAYVDEQRPVRGHAPARAPRAARRAPRPARHRRAVRARPRRGRGRRASRPGAVHALAAGITRAELEQACDRLVTRDLLVPSHAGVDRRVAALSARPVPRGGLCVAREGRACAACTSGTPPGSTGWAASLPEADARIGFHLETACRYAQEIGDGRAGRARVPGRPAARGRGPGRPRPRRPARRDRLSRPRHRGCSAPNGSRASRCCRRWSRRSPRRGRPTARRSSRIARSRASAALGLPGVGARSAIERERIRLYRHPESFDVPAAVAVVEQATETLRELGDELGLARAAYLMSDLAWLMGDPVASYAHAERMLSHARRAGSGFEAATALTFMAWALVEGPWPAPVAIARCDALTERGGRPASRRAGPARLPRRAHGDDRPLRRGAQQHGRGARRARPSCIWAGSRSTSSCSRRSPKRSPVTRRRRSVPSGMPRRRSSDSDDRWYLSLINVDLAHAILAQGRLPEAADAVARIETAPAPCDAEWVIKRHTARALLAAQAGEPERGLEDARGCGGRLGCDRPDPVPRQRPPHAGRTALGDRSGRTQPRWLRDAPSRSTRPRPTRQRPRARGNALPASSLRRD